MANPVMIEVQATSPVTNLTNNRSVAMQPCISLKRTQSEALMAIAGEALNELGSCATTHSGDALSMGDGTPKSPKRTALFGLFDAEDDSSSSDDENGQNDDDEEWDEWDETDESDGQPTEDYQDLLDMFGLGGGNAGRGCGLMVTSLTSCSSKPNGSTVKTTTTTICDRNGGGGSSTTTTSASTSSAGPCLLAMGLRSLFNGGCGGLIGGQSTPQSSVPSASSSTPLPSNISASTVTEENNDSASSQQQHSTISANIAIPFAQQNGHHSDNQKDQVESSSSSPAVSTIYSFNESLSPDSFNSCFELTQEDIERNQKCMVEDEASRLAVLEANQKWADTIALWREEMGPRGVTLDYDLVDRATQDELGKGEQIGDEDDSTAHEGMLFFCELDANEVQVVKEKEKVVDDDDGDLNVQFIGEDENDGREQQTQPQPQPSSQNKVTVATVDTFTPNSDFCRYRSIRFSPLPTVVHLIEQGDECRQTPWLDLATERILQHERMNRTLAPIFAAQHRERIYQQRFAEKDTKVDEEKANAKIDNV